MPPKANYSKDDLVEAAVKVVQEQGLGRLTARAVAAQLGSSTAPVYHLFDSMDDLVEALLKRIQAMAIDAMHVAYTPRHFLNIGMGFAIFARDEPRLFRALHLESTRHRHLIDDLFDRLKESMIQDPRFTDTPDAERRALLTKMWTFTFGLSIQLSFDLIRDPSDLAIEQILYETGTIVIADALNRGGVSRTRPPWRA